MIPAAEARFSPQRAGRMALLTVVLAACAALPFPPTALAQTPMCSATSVAITGITAVTIDANTDTSGLVADCNTLLGLKDTLRGATTLSPDWAVGTAMDTWSETSITVGGNTLTEPGIIIAGTPPRVTELDLGGISLAGTVPADLGNLDALIELNLRLNDLTGELPAELGNLANLTHLYLDENQLTGPIPSAWGTSTYPLPNLDALVLSGNQLTGSIPSTLGDLPKLRHLSIDTNQLTGSIPPALGKPTLLEAIFLGGNQLTGSIPSAWGTSTYPLANLQQLYLNGNQLTGSIPPALGNLANLQWLYLHGNQLTGSIPPALGNLANLQRLRLDRNELTGSIPPALGNLTNLQWLLLNYNPLTGPIPAALADLPSLQYLYFHGTNWTGTIPQALLDKILPGFLTNRRPVAPTVRDQSLSGGQPFEYPVVFTDPEGETLTYHATVAGATPAEDTSLPAWLMFDRATGTLSGTLPRGELIGESLMVRVVATDEDTLAATDIPCDPDRPAPATEMNRPRLCGSVLVTLTGPPNHPPVGPVVSTLSFPRPRPVEDPPRTEGSSITVPFCDPESQDLTYTATQADGSPLPDWLILGLTNPDADGRQHPFLLSFNYLGDRVHESFPAVGESVAVTITATDTLGASTSVTFTIAVVASTEPPVYEELAPPNCDSPPPSTGQPPGGTGGGGTGTGGTGTGGTGTGGTGTGGTGGGSGGGGTGGTGGGGGAEEEDDTAELMGLLENPGPASFQSGVGVISGWVCEAETVEIEIAPETGAAVRYVAAYGTERLDTARRADGTPLCGDTDNGFGLLFNWNRLGDGEHTVVAYVDGEELGRAVVTVTTLGHEFLRDVAGTCTVDAFPSPGETVTLVWQQNSQNFVIADGSPPSGVNRAGTPGVGYLENPGPNAFQSGVGVLSGWVCEAETVEMEIGHLGRQVAAYGTERLDTEAACGDTDNGFGLLFNWNRLGDGEHEVVAYVDEAELGRATVQVTTLGEEFVRGAEGMCEVADFPMDGETVTLEWQQTSQNFVVTGVE